MKAHYTPGFDDDAFIAETLQRGYQPYTGVRCRWCDCPAEHGFVCGNCQDCDSSFTCRDDSWRPRNSRSTAFKRLDLMALTGVDGWAAAAACSASLSARTARIHAALLGRT